MCLSSFMIVSGQCLYYFWCYFIFTVHQTPYELHSDRRRDESMTHLFAMKHYWLLIPVAPSLCLFSLGGKGLVAEGCGVLCAWSVGCSLLRASIALPDSLRSLLNPANTWSWSSGVGRHGPEPTVKHTRQQGAVLQPSSAPALGSGQGFPRQHHVMAEKGQIISESVALMLS